MVKLNNLEREKLAKKLLKCWRLNEHQRLTKEINHNQYSVLPFEFNEVFDLYGKHYKVFILGQWGMGEGRSQRWGDAKAIFKLTTSKSISQDENELVLFVNNKENWVEYQYDYNEDRTVWDCPIWGVKHVKSCE